MKIAWIDHLCNVEAEKSTIIEFSELIKKGGIELYCAESLNEFRKLHGDLANYQGVLMHPGVEMQENIFDVEEEFPGIPLAIVSHLPEDYWKDRIPVFSYEHPDKIAEFFKSKTTTQVKLQ